MDDADHRHETQSVKAVYDDDLTAYLTSLGLDPSGVLGKCKFDSADVTLANLSALFPLSGSLKLVCSRRECIAGLQDLIRDGAVRL